MTTTHIVSSPMSQPLKKNQKLYFPKPDAKFSFLHALDAARALACLCREKPEQVYNIGSPNAWTLRELMNRIEQVVGKKFTYGGIDDTPSPLGISEDYYMNVDRAKKAGFLVAELKDWMPALIKELSLA